MKGISAVIATILILMIVIALAGMTYFYTVGMFTARTAKTIAVTDSGCFALQTPGYYVSIKNLDTAATITVSSDLSARVDNVLATGLTCIVGGSTSPTIGAGLTANCNITGTTGGSAGSLHRIKVIGSANSEEVPASC